MAPRVKRLPLQAFFCIHSDSAGKRHAEIASGTLATAVFKTDGFKEACTAFQEPPRSLYSAPGTVDRHCVRNFFH